MLEGLVATVLNRFLGMYVKNFDANQLQVGIWSGEVKLKNLELRREALDQLRLPVNVVEGHLGQLTLAIPLSNLRGKAVKVNIQDVFLLAAPKEDAEYNEKDEKSRAQKLKMEKLENAELLKDKNSQGVSEEEQQKNQSFTESLVTAIVDNIQISIKNIHVRYEDSISAPGHPFAFGVTLKEFSAISTDENWKATFIQSTSSTTHKLATLGSLAFYWNTDAKLFGTGKGSQQMNAKAIDHDQVKQKFMAAIESNEDQQYMLKPVSGKAGIVIDKSGKIDKPKVKARLMFNELGFVLDEDQYRDALLLADLFHYFLRHQEYKQFQPKSSPKEDPRAWLKFAGDTVLRKIHDRNRRWTWDYMRERRDDRIRYIDLFKQKKRGQTFPPGDQADLERLEKKLSFEDLKFWRSLARNQLRKENAAIKKPEPKQTWTSWAWGTKQEDKSAGDNPTFSDEERKQLYEVLDWDEKKALAESIDEPHEAIKLQIEGALQTGSFTLKRDPHGTANEILSLMFDNFQANALQRFDSFLADVSLGGLRVYDGTTHGSLFPQIVRVKGMEAMPRRPTAQIHEDSEMVILRSMDSDNDRKENSLFHLVFEQNPLDGTADSAVTITLKSIEVIYNAAFIVEIAKFFQPPERHMESIGALMETAGATVEGLRQQTRAGLEFALQEHKTINAKLDIQAPLLIIPESITEKSSLCLILDAGHIGLNSKLVDKDTLQEIQSKQKTKYNDEDFRKLEDLMYDKFLVKLDSTQVLIGPGIEATKAELESTTRKKNYHIIERISMDFVLESLIIPKDTSLTKTRISGHLPVLHASISDKKYKGLMRIIDVAIPQFENSQEEPTTIANKQVTLPMQKLASPTKQRPASMRAASSTFQLRDQHHDIVMDDESDADATKGQAPARKDVNMNQRQFEFNFTVDMLQGSLYRSDSNGSRSDQLLVEMVAEHFELNFYLRPFDMVAEVLLKTLSVEDYIDNDPSPEFKKILSSQQGDPHSTEALFQLQFIKVNRNSPDFKTKYEGIMTHLDVSIATINLVVTRRTLLTLLDFVLETFANPESQVTSDSKKPLGLPEAEPIEKAVVDSPPPTDQIRMRVVLTSVALVLNNDGIRLATLSFNTANIGIFLSGGAMKISARLGSLSLLDDVNQGAGESSPLRQLVTIQGDELAHFKYETYLPQTEAYPGYDSLIFLRSGSIKVHFLDEPFRKIMEFLVKFGKMQAIFNAARQAAANQATQIQENAATLHFDILIKTPIIVFPRAMESKWERDRLTAELGEIYAINTFLPAEGSTTGVMLNQIDAGIRNVRLTSIFYYQKDHHEELQMLEKLNLDFKIRYMEHEDGMKRPDIEVEGTMSPINLQLSQVQLKCLLELSHTIPVAFSPDSQEHEAEALDELPESTVAPAQAVSDLGTPKSPSQIITHQGPELGHSSDTWTKVDLVFKAETIGLELILAAENEPIGNTEERSLSTFAIHNTHLKLRMLSDNALESELLIQSFAIADSRKKEGNKFKKIMSLINDNVKQQFMASISISGGEERHLIAIATIDSPRIIFALDYVFALTTFASSAFASPEQFDAEVASQIGSPIGSPLMEYSENEVAEMEPPKLQSKASESSGMSMSFRANIEDAQIILIANPTISNSEAIVLGTKEVLLSQQNATTLQITKVGMFLCRMDKFETSRLRILDDFSVMVSLDTRAQGNQATLISIHVDVESLVLRLSLRDILLAVQIVNKASELTGRSSIQEEPVFEEPKKIKQVKALGSSTMRHSKKPSTIGRGARSLAASKKIINELQPVRRGSIILKREELTAEIHGIRVILIGDLHELPLVDWSVKKFNVDVRDWSGSMSGDTSFDTYMNVYNFSKSAWEPLIEPWQLGFHLSKQQHPDRMAMELYSHKNLELTITSATIALASKSAQFLSTDEDVLSKPRGADAPFRIRNYTGFQINVWAAAREEDQGPAATLEDGEEALWRFEDATSMREKLSPEGSSGIVGIKLEGSGFDSLERIPVSREGEKLYNLKPRQEKIQHRLLVEVKLGADSVKYITFRSPLQVENNTQIPIELGVFSPEEGHLLKIEKILPGESRPAPVGAAFKHSLVVRPDQGFGYSWSNERLFWKDLIKRPTRTITCTSESREQSPPFHFQMNATYDKNDPMTSIYPYMKLRFSAPIEIQNLLPFDFKYRIYDKTTKKDWTNFLRKGGVSPVHVVELSHLLLLSIHMQDTVFKQSEFAIINSNTQEDFRRESRLVVKDHQDIELHLKLHYFNVSDSGGAFKVSVFSPYLVLNKTGLNISIQSKSMFSAARSAAGQGVMTQSESASAKALPYMFSFPSDDRKNRAILKIGNSSWSKPQSFDAIGDAFDTVLPARDGKSEMHVGIAVTEGESKYKLTKIITVTPRFIIKNKIGEAIQIREPGSSDVTEVEQGSLLPLRFLHQTSDKQICLCFPGVNNQWSSPSNISNVGTVHVKIAKAGQRQKLVRVEVIMEGATLFIHLSIETKHWPFSMRNESDMEFMFHQTNPNLGDDEEDQGSGWRSIRYRLPPRSIMPYAWDYPAARLKELVIVANGRERRVKLAEIGNLLPMKIPMPQGGQPKIVDLNIVAEGPTQTLVLSNYRQSKSLYKQKSGGGSQAGMAAGFEVKEFNLDVNFKAQLRFAGVGISLVNKNLKELLYFTLREIELKYSDSQLYQTFQTTIKWIQIDNQLYGGIFPILLYPSVVPKTGKEMEAHPILHAMVTRVKDDSYGVLFIKYATLLLQQLTVELDEDFIFAMLDFTKVPGASWSEEGEGKLCDEELGIPEATQEEQGQDVYFELLHLQPMQLDLSFVRTERINAEDTMQSNSPIMFVVNILTMSIGNVNDAPLRLNALMLENARISISTLLANIQSHYTQEIIRQVHIILGSADFLGNPVGLFNNISSGVADIFYEPYQGLVMTDRPQELGIGIAKGASSFVKKSVFGFSDSMAKFTGSVSKGLAVATLDKEYQDQRRMSKSRNRPKHALYGVTSGGNAFATSLASGIGGLARHPLEGAEKEGFQGFVKGVGKGFLGLATKPAIGAFDLASNLAEGVRNTTTVFDADGLDRVRLTRFIGSDGVVRPFSDREALGQFWLKTLDDGKSFHEDYIAHLELPGKDMIVMLTYNRIMLVRSKNLRTEWDIKLTDIMTISKERTGLGVTLKGGTNGPFIPVADEASRNWLYRQIGVAVNAFNERYNAKG